jgi:tryptophan synthase alpha chain
VGSAIVRLIAEHGKNAPKYVNEYVKSMKEGMGA